MRARGSYFDGRTGAAQAVELTLERRSDAPWLVVRPEDPSALTVQDTALQIVPTRDLRVSERLGAAPRVLELPDGRGRIELHRDAATERLLAELGATDNWGPRLARSVPAVLLSLALLGALAWGTYRHVLPWAAEVGAERVSPAWAARLSRPALEWLMHGTRETSVPSERQAALRRAVAAASWPGLDVPLTLHFRDAPAIGANAMALPSGDIVLTDALVALAGPRDDLVMAVLAHEVGHVAGRHGLRILIHGSVVSALATWWLGDVSALAAAAPTVLTQAVYSRDMETAADDYAARVLQGPGQSPESLALMLERLQAAHRSAKEDEGKKAEEPAALDILASHPHTPERIARLRRAAATR